MLQFPKPRYTPPCISGAYGACRGWDAVPVRQTTSEGCHAHNGVLALATMQFMKTL
jgi:hypothetical protein